MCDDNYPSSELTLLINTCDAYADVLSVYLAALQLHWPDRECPIVINTETRQPGQGEGLIVHNFAHESGVDVWGARLISTLESINSEFVLMVYDDYILEAALNTDKLNRALDVLKSEPNASVIYLASVGFSINNEKFADEQPLSMISDYSDYRLNSAPALWRKTDLLHYTGMHDNPWAWEVFGSYRTFGDGKSFYCPTTPADDIYIYNSRKGGAIYRGKWVREVVDVIQRTLKIDIDYNIRGFSAENRFEKRSLKWKFEFFLTGHRMIGNKVFLFVFRYLRAKING